MELRTLRYFLAVAREGTVTGGAAALHITQPTLSRQIRELEESFGKALFVRGGPTLTLTPEGHLLRQRAEEILALADRTEALLRAPTKGIHGTVALAAGEVPTLHPVADVLRAVQARHPGVRYALHSVHATEALRLLDAGVVDFALLLHPVDTSRYESLPLPHTVRWCAMLRHDHPLAAKASLAPEDLVGHPLILSHRLIAADNRATACTAWFGSLHAKLRVAAVCDLAYVIRLLAEHGLGVALTLERDRATAEFPDLVVRPLTPPIVSGFSVAWKRARLFSPAAAAVHAALAEAFAQPPPTPWGSAADPPRLGG